MPMTLLPPPVTREDFLSRKIDAVRGSFRRVVITRAICSGVALFGLIIGFLLWLDIGERLPPLVRTYAVMLLVIGIITYWRRFIHQPLKGSGNPDHLAKLVERRYPDFRDAFRSAVFFLNPSDNTTTSSSDLRQAAIRRAVRKLEDRDVRDAVDRRGTIRSILFASLTILLWCWFAASKTDLLYNQTKRLVLPFSGLQSTQQTSIEIINIKKFPHRIAKGDSLELQVKINGVVPERLMLILKPDELATIEQTYLITDKQNDEVSITIRIEPNRMQRSFQFKLKANDADSNWKDVLVLPPPVLIPLNGRPSPQFELIYPQYTRLPNTSLPDGSSIIECPVGTTIVVNAASDRPIAKTSITHQPEQPIIAPVSFLSLFATKSSHELIGLNLLLQSAWTEQPLNVISETQIHGQIRPQLSGTYAFRIEDETGLGSTRLLDIRLQPDPSPIVTMERLINGREQIIALPNATIRLPVRVQDTIFGMRNLSLNLRVNQEATQQRAIYTPELISNTLPTLLRLGSTDSSLRLARFDLPQRPLLSMEPVLDISSIKHANGQPLKDGDIITVTYEADDFDNVTAFKALGRSADLRIIIVSKQDIDTIIQQTQSDIRNELSKLKQQQLEAIKRVDSEIKNKQSTEQLFDAEQLQEQIRNKITQGTDNVGAQIRQLQQELNENKIPENTAIERLNETRKELDRLAQEELDSITTEFGTAKRLTDPAAKETALKKIAEKQRSVDRALTELIERLEPWSGAGEIRGEARNLASDLKKAAEQARQLADRVPDKTVKEQLDPTAKAELERSISQAERVNDQARQFVEKLNRLAIEKEQSAQEKRLQAEQLQSKANALRTQAENADKDSPEQRQLSNQANTTQRDAMELKEAAEELQREANALRQAAQAGNTEELKEQLRTAANAAKQNQLNQTANQQAAAKENVERLLKSLQDTDKQDAERLQKKAEQAKQELDQIIAEQERLQKKIDTAEKISDDNLRRSELKKLAQQQEQLQQQSVELARRLNRQQAEFAAEQLRRAATDMAKSAEQLREGENTGEKTDDALDRLDEAKRELGQAEQNQDEKLNREQSAQLQDTLKELLERQRRIQGESNRIHSVVVKVKKWERPVKVSQNDLRLQQLKLAEDVDALTERELTKQVVYARILRQATRAMKLAGKRMDARLETADNGPFDEELESIAHQSIISQQELALSRLEQLIDALKPENQPKQKQRENAPAEPQEQPPQAAKKDPPQAKLPPLAQLKALRNLQADIVKRTAKFNEAHPDRAKLNDDELDELVELELMQRDIAELIKEISGDISGEMR